MSIGSSPQSVKKSYQAPSAPPKGTSTLKNSGTQPLHKGSTNKASGTQKLTEKAGKVQGQIQTAQNRYEAGKAAYQAAQDGRVKEHVKQVVVDAVKDKAYEKTLGKTPLGKLKNLGDSVGSVFSNLKDGNFKEALNSAKESVENFKETVSSTKDFLASKTGQKVVTKVGATAVGSAVAKAGAEVAEKAAVKTAAKVAAKAAGRFVPGVNVAIFAADAHHAAKVLSDPQASTWKKGAAVVTAVGSAMAASNIPAVSQVGAAIATAAAIVEDISPKKIFNTIKGWFGK